MGSVLYCPIVRIDFQDQYCHKERGEDKGCRVKEERREGETGEEKKEGREGRKNRRREGRKES